MKIHIKNMVCNRCIAVVRAETEKLGIIPTHVSMGEVEFDKLPPNTILEQLDERLKFHGFEILDDKKSKLIEQIKNIIIQQVHYSGEKMKMNYSDLLSSRLNKDYSALSNLFSETEGVTIEQYIILQKIERVKELLIYDEMSLSQIADELGYSSVAHLSAQFKKVIGMTPSNFKALKEKSRKSLDKVHAPK